MVSVNNFDILRSQFDLVLFAKNNDMNGEQLIERRKFVSMLFVLLKKCSRNDKSVVKLGRDELLKKKNQVDSYRLQLQNLLYEINHLKKEIRNCYLFKSLDEDINLLSQDDYAISSNGPTEHSHNLRVMCLQSELNLRKQLHIDYNNLMNTKKTLYRDILLKIERHSLFVPALKVLVKATKPLTEALQISLTEEWELNEQVNLLLRPLYLTFVNLHAIQQMLESAIKVEVLDSEILMESTEVMHQKNSLNNSNDTLPKPSKYMIRITIKETGEFDDCLMLDIRYFNEIGFATISPSISTKTFGNIFCNENYKDILRYVVEKDFGDVAPTHSCETKLRCFDLSLADFIKYLENVGYGKPYIWLQKFCSIPVDSCLKWNEKKLQKFMMEIIGKIRKVWCQQMSILQQIYALTNKCYEYYLQNNSFGYKPLSKLAQWTIIKWQDYKTQHSTQMLAKSIFIDKHSHFYRAVLVRGSAKLECFVSILGKLCFSNPVWALCLHWNGEHTAKNNASIKDMEFCVNSVGSNTHDSENQILLTQLLITMKNLDIYLESTCLLQMSQEFVSENLYQKPFKKKSKFSTFFSINKNCI